MFKERMIQMQVASMNVHLKSVRVSMSKKKPCFKKRILSGKKAYEIGHNDLGHMTLFNLLNVELFHIYPFKITTQLG